MVDPDKGEIFMQAHKFQLCRHPIQKEIEEIFQIPLRLKMMSTVPVSQRSPQAMQKARSNNAVCLTIEQASAVASARMARSFMVLNSACEVGYLHLLTVPQDFSFSTTALVEYGRTSW